MPLVGLNLKSQREDLLRIGLAGGGRLGELGLENSPLGLAHSDLGALLGSRELQRCDGALVSGERGDKICPRRERVPDRRVQVCPLGLELGLRVFQIRDTGAKGLILRVKIGTIRPKRRDDLFVFGLLIAQERPKPRDLDLKRNLSLRGTQREFMSGSTKGAGKARLTGLGPASTLAGVGRGGPAGAGLMAVDLRVRERLGERIRFELRQGTSVPGAGDKQACILTSFRSAVEALPRRPLGAETPP